LKYWRKFLNLQGAAATESRVKRARPSTPHLKRPVFKRTRFAIYTFQKQKSLQKSKEVPGKSTIRNGNGFVFLFLTKAPDLKCFHH
jgi:hypothetical protein